MKRRHFIGVLGMATSAMAMGRGKAHKPKYIFLMIGDGMGVAQRQIAERYARMKYPARNGGLRMNHLPVSGLTTTHEVSGKVTDSAAAGTALACGVKTSNGVLGLTDDLSTPLRSIAEDARDTGKKVGIVTSVPVDHATPASFYAKVPKRSMNYEIDEFLARSGFDYFAGEPMLGRNKAKDKTPPEQLVKQAGYRLVSERAGFDALKPGSGKVLVEHSLGYALEGKQEISLADYTRKGIELLDGKHGFFMMVEGGKIDWCGHANDLASNIKETLAFNEAVDVAYDFYLSHPDETLIVVTADHETGGLQINGGAAPEGFVAAIDAQKFQAGHYSTKVKQWKKSGAVAPDTAYDRLLGEFTFQDLSPEKETHLRELVIRTMTNATVDARSPELKKMYGKKNMAVVGCLHEVAARSGSKWTSFGHTDTRVETTAVGRWANRFGGESDNTDIGRNLRELIQ
jgi:alkaline phosphatase